MSITIKIYNLTDRTVTKSTNCDPNILQSDYIRSNAKGKVLVVESIVYHLGIYEIYGTESTLKYDHIEFKQEGF